MARAVLVSMNGIVISPDEHMIDFTTEGYARSLWISPRDLYTKVAAIRIYSLETEAFNT